MLAGDARERLVAADFPLLSAGEVADAVWLALELRADGARLGRPARPGARSTSASRTFPARARPRASSSHHPRLDADDAAITFSSPDAPRAVGPYSQAVASGDHVFLSGQTPIDPATGALVDADVGGQTQRCFDNLGGRARCGGLDVRRRRQGQRVSHLDGRLRRDERGLRAPVRRSRSRRGRPSRVAALPLGARIEIELVAAA